MTDGRRPHLPQRPIWLCRVCALDWPCLTARTLLPIEYHDDPAGLSVYLATMLHEAVSDLYRLNPAPGPDPAAMHQRFLAWTRPRLAITRARLGATPTATRRPFASRRPSTSGCDQQSCESGQDGG